MPRRDRSSAESLEIRGLLSASAWPGLLNPQTEVAANDTLDVAQNLGHVGRNQNVEVIGSLGTGTARTTDVDWFRFTVDATSRVQLTALPDATGANSAVDLTLYGDQLSALDPALPLQHRLLGRREAAIDSAARLDLRLTAGTYFVAVSGAGNRDFHPFVADSGLPAAATDYGLKISVQSGIVPPGPTDQFAPLPELRINGDDTPATATNLGNLNSIARLQVRGAIGDDRFYSVVSTDPSRRNPAADVDLYRFTITGNGSYALVADALAGRIGSALDPALTLYRADATGALRFVGTHDNTQNPTVSTNGQYPFAADAALFAGLSAGDYFLAVSSSGNSSEFGTEGVFDPQVAHSGRNGGTVGNYVLDLLVYADSTAPQVVGQVVSVPSFGEIELSAERALNLPHAPTQLRLQFSEQVNVQQLADSAFQQAGANVVRAVFIVGADGQRYFPRLQSFDLTNSTARFLMLGGLPDGASELHVSGAAGLTDWAGHPIAGNDASGDFVVRFTVSDPSRAGVPTLRTNATNNDSLATAQDLGTLFPHELQAGVKLTRDAATNAGQTPDTADSFRFEALQTQSYFFTLTNHGSGVSPAIKIFDAGGRLVRLASQPGGSGLLGFLRAGTYVLQVGPWTAVSAGDIEYQVDIKLGGVSENPTPLTSGAGSVISIQLVGGGPVSQSSVAVTYSRATPTNETSSAIPAGLLAGLNAPALGGQGITPAVPTSDTALVRLFGFSDRLFSLIDSSLPRTPVVQVVTQAELTDVELLDLVNQARTAVEPESAAGELNETDEAPVTDGSSLPTRDAVSNERVPTSKPLSKARRLSSPRTRPQDARPVEEQQQTSATGAATTLALATSLAVTLRERKRREVEELLFS